MSDEEHDQTPVQRPRPSAGNWGLLLLLVGVLAFVAWGVWLVTRPQPKPHWRAPASGDAARAVQLIRGVADTFRDDPGARRECLGALRVLPADARTEGIVRCLRSTSADFPELRNAAAYFGGQFVADDLRLLYPLVAALEEEAEMAAFALSRSPSTKAFAALSEEAHSQSTKAAVHHAIWALAVRKEAEATDALLEVVVTSPSQLNGKVAAEALGYRRDPKAYRPLVSLLETIQRTETPCTAGERAALALAWLGQDAALKHLRQAAHRVGDYATSERLTLAFALCRLRPPDDYNFRILARGVRVELPPAWYRTDSGPNQPFIAIPLIVQLNDVRVKSVLIDASNNSGHMDGGYATLVIGAFAKLGLEPAWDEQQGAYVLRELPPDKAPKHPPYALMPPWPFSEVAGRGDGGGGADGLDPRS